MDAPEDKTNTRADKLQAQAQRLMEAMFDQALSEIGKKHILSPGAKATRKREARRVETALYSVSISTDSTRAQLSWELNIPAIEARAREIGQPDTVSRVMSKFLGGSNEGTPANWRFCIIVGEKAFGISSAISFKATEIQARVSSKISDNHSVPLNSEKPETAVFFVMFDHSRRFVIDADITAMLQNEPASTFDDVVSLRRQFDAVANKVWPKEEKTERTLSDRERMLEEISEAFETKALLKARLETLGYAGVELDEAMENVQHYIHQLLKNGMIKSAAGERHEQSHRNNG